MLLDIQRKQMRVGVIGTGAMGRPIAMNCLTAGHSVIVYNRTRAKADELQSFGAEVASSVYQTCSCDVVITILADDAALEDVVFRSQEFFSSFTTNSVHISASTISVSMAKKLADAHADRGVPFLAAPIMGRPEMAVSRKIALLAAGERSAYERCLPVLESISQNIRLVSHVPWHANLLKLCGNFLLLSAIETLAEIFAFLPEEGIAPSRFLEVMDQTLFSIPFYQSYGTRMIAGEFLPSGFRLELARKDSSLLREILNERGIRLPINDAIHTRLESAVSQGYKDHDTAALALTMQYECRTLFEAHLAGL
jgi:3-hydroxyisobutyrate dehydrogenase-like beta-hydroxyacid dehydrogenase